MKKNMPPILAALKIEDIREIEKNPNILIAARLWENDRFEAARICYKFLRRIDDMVDDQKSKNLNISACERLAYTEQINEWIDCLSSNRGNAPFIQEVVETIKKYNIPLHLFHTFAKSMIYDLNNEGFQTYEHFIAYAEGASVAPASIFVHLCCLDNGLENYTIPNMDLLETARPCAIFSYLVHIIRDFEQDYKENLVYLANDQMERFNVTQKDLFNAAYGIDVSDGFRKLISQYCLFAEGQRLKTLAIIEQVTPHLSPQYLASLQVIYSLYNLVYQKINPAEGTFLKEELNPSPEEIYEKLIKVASACFV
jgi:phytoene/squalene synthetase